MPRPVNQPADTLIGIELQNASLLDFWMWAFSDLCDDDLKGIFAEWIVLKLLKMPGIRRVSWANSDIIAANGVRIEIKATSYWQSWKLLDETGVLRPTPLYTVSSESKIRFAGLKARNAVTIANGRDPQLLKSHVYIFAFQNEKDTERWNAMDISQWEFYALPVSVLRDHGWNSISLTKLRAEQKRLSDYEILTADSFAEVAKGLIEAAASSMKTSG